MADDGRGRGVLALAMPVSAFAHDGGGDGGDDEGGDNSGPG